MPKGKKSKRFSVLLLYPPEIADGGSETFYAFVRGADAAEAVRKARLQLTKGIPSYWEDPAGGDPKKEREDLMERCSVELVLRGWVRGLPV